MTVKNKNRPPTRLLKNDLCSNMNERFMAKVHIEEETGCWVWKGSCKRIGGAGFYGHLGDGQLKNICPRRYAFINFGLVPIPRNSKYRLLNRCGVLRCVNPAHFKLLKVNTHCKEEPAIVESNSKNEHKHNYRKEISIELVKMIRADIGSLDFLASKYNVNPILIRRLQRRVCII